MRSLSYVAKYDVPGLIPDSPISLCYDCWERAGRPTAEQHSDDAVFDWAKENDAALYEKLIHCELCGGKFAFVKD